MPFVPPTESSKNKSRATAVPRSVAPKKPSFDFGKFRRDFLEVCTEIRSELAESSRHAPAKGRSDPVPQTSERKAWSDPVGDDDWEDPYANEEPYLSREVVSEIIEDNLPGDAELKQPRQPSLYDDIF